MFLDSPFAKTFDTIMTAANGSITTARMTIRVKISGFVTALDFFA